jgi:hypothetical protein
MKAKFKKGQVVQTDSGAFGIVVKIYQVEEKTWYALEGDMYPTQYPEDGLRGLTKKQKGAVLIELAFALPIFMLFMLGALDLLLCVTQRGSVVFLTQQAAVCLQKVGCDANVYIQNNAPALGLNMNYLTYTVSINQVQISYNYQPVGPVWPRNTVLSATATNP